MNPYAPYTGKQYYAIVNFFQEERDQEIKNLYKKKYSLQKFIKKEQEVLLRYAYNILSLWESLTIPPQNPPNEVIKAQRYLTYRLQMRILPPGLTFNDVYLVPQFSSLFSRQEADTETIIANIPLKTPIISANMSTVTWSGMAMAMYDAGGLGILHRYKTPEEIIAAIKALRSQNIPAIPSVGVKPQDLENIFPFYEAGATAFCIDIAHAHSKAITKIINKIHALNDQIRSYNKDNPPDDFFNTDKPLIPIIAGNVATYEGALYLADFGVDVIKVGISQGSHCLTKDVTGHGVPQLTAIMDCAKVKNRYPKVKIIADGSIKSSGDIVKALAAGADAIMTGYLLAGTDETPKKGIYSGMASKESQESFLGKVNNDTPEGKTTEVPDKGPVGEIIKQLTGGIRSGMSYSGARTIRELQEKAVFMQLTPGTLR